MTRREKQRDQFLYLHFKGVSATYCGGADVNIDILLCSSSQRNDQFSTSRVQTYVLGTLVRDCARDVAICLPPQTIVLAIAAASVVLRTFLILSVIPAIGR